MWSEKRLQDVDKIGVLLRFKSQFHYYHVCLCKDTDFIFCTVGEEQGFLGASAVLIVFGLFILRLIVLAERQDNAFGRVYGYSVASIFFFHLAINVGMVTGLTPVIGIPLPFFSYGGSSLWGFTILLFIFLRLDASRKER